MYMYAGTYVYASLYVDVCINQNKHTNRKGLIQRFCEMKIVLSFILCHSIHPPTLKKTA